MRRWLILVVLTASGCCGVVGPLEPRLTTRVDDPCVTIGEQERRSRDRLALPEWNPAIVPGGISVLPGPSGR